MSQTGAEQSIRIQISYSQEACQWKYQMPIQQDDVQLQLVTSLVPLVLPNTQNFSSYILLNFRLKLIASG